MLDKIKKKLVEGGQRKWWKVQKPKALLLLLLHDFCSILGNNDRNGTSSIDGDATEAAAAAVFRMS